MSAPTPEQVPAYVPTTDEVRRAALHEVVVTPNQFDHWLAQRDAQRDAEVARQVLPRPEDGCACTWHTQDAGGGHSETLAEYEPACPEHSEHVYDPRTGVWVTLAEHDRVVMARAWDEGYDRAESDRECGGFWVRGKRGNPYRAAALAPEGQGDGEVGRG